MSTITEIFIPSTIIVIANVFSREHGSERYECITAMFGWFGGILLTLGFLIYVICFFLIVFGVNLSGVLDASKIIMQIGTLSAVTAMSRDYEKMLKPNANYFEEKAKSIYQKIKQVTRNIKR